MKKGKKKILFISTLPMAHSNALRKLRSHLITAMSKGELLTFNSFSEKNRPPLPDHLNIYLLFNKLNLKCTSIDKLFQLYFYEKYIFIPQRYCMLYF